MNIEEFVELVRSEPERIIVRSVRVPSPGTLKEASRPGGMTLSDFIAAPASMEQRTFRYRHVLGSPAEQSTIDAWKSKHPSHPLPADLELLLRRINGIHLWANAETGRSYSGLAPIEEWVSARAKLYGEAGTSKPMRDEFLSLTYNADGSEFACLNTATGVYYMVDAAGHDDSAPLGSSISDLLGWLWRRRIAPR